ncbi:MAG: hypothetical protein ACJ75B_08240 [Flavisolibacter sp.]
MKKIILACSLLLRLNVWGSDPTIPQEIEKHFQEIYPSAQKVMWSKTEKGYGVYFENGEVRCRFEYDSNGKVIHSLRYFKADLLPPLLTQKIFQRWSQRKIYGVTEVSTPDRLYYVIILEDAKYWYTIESDQLGDFTQKNKENKA